LSFLSLSCLKRWGGLARSCGESRWALPVPLLSGWRGAMGVGRGAAGQDGMVEVCCRSGLRWVGCKEEKAHTDLTGAPSPHPNERRSHSQQSPVLGTLLAASRSHACPGLAAGYVAPTLPAERARAGGRPRLARLCQAGAKSKTSPVPP